MRLSTASRAIRSFSATKRAWESVRRALFHGVVVVGKGRQLYAGSSLIPLRARCFISRISVPPFDTPGMRDKTSQFPWPDA